MTLIISVLTWGKVFQVSDRRLFNNITGEAETDYSNKQITLSCQDAAITFSYTGLAMVGSNQLKTLDWLTNILNKIDAPALTVNDIRIQLSAKWKEIISHTYTHEDLSNITSSIVMAGFFRIGEPFAIRIHSNKTDEFFQVIIKKKKSKFCAIVIDGFLPAINKDIRTRIKKLKKIRFFQNSTKENGIRELISLIRATQRGCYGKYIGTNCLGISIVPHLTLVGNFEIYSDYQGVEFRDFVGPYHTHISEHLIISSADEEIENDQSLNI